MNTATTTPQPLQSLVPGVTVSDMSSLFEEQRRGFEALAFLQHLATEEEFWDSQANPAKAQVMMGMCAQALVNHLEECHHRIWQTWKDEH